MILVAFTESGCLGLQPKVGGKLHLMLNTGTRPIANKYREGKVKSTLKRESKRPRNRWEGSECERVCSVRVQGGSMSAVVDDGQSTGGNGGACSIPHSRAGAPSVDGLHRDWP